MALLRRVIFAMPIGAAILLLVAGCGATSGWPSATAALPLERILPAPVLPAPATRSAASTDSPPLEALALYARARVALADGHAADAIDSLERAVQIDPDSYELRHSLGKALRESAGGQMRALDHFQRAAELEPDRIDAQIDLGREWIRHNDATRALTCFRLAIQTSQYSAGDSRRDEADFLLAATLSEKGYLRAAMDRVQLLASRLTQASESYSPRMMRVQLQIGDLYLQQRRPADALAAFRIAEATRTGVDDLTVTARIIYALLASRRTQDAEQTALTAAVRHCASSESVTLLRKTFRMAGDARGALPKMTALCRQRPDDPVPLFALCQLATAEGNPGAAERILEDLWQQSPERPAVLVRRFELRWAKDDAAGAVRLAIEAVARHPELLEQIGPIWTRLLSPEGRRRITPEQIQRLPVRPAEEVARQTIVWRLARQWDGNVSVATAGAIGEDASLESLRLRLKNCPSLDEIYIALHERYVQLGEYETAEAVLAAWQRAWPPGVPNPRLLLLRARRLIAEERFEAAELTLAELEQQHPAYPGLLEAQRIVYERSGRAAKLGAAVPR
jgi:tetratricopeptide (TPR) repeat protein